MCTNSDQTMIAQQQIQAYKRKAQDLMSEALAQIRERSKDVSLASIAAQMKAVLGSSAIWMKFLKNRIS